MKRFFCVLLAALICSMAGCAPQQVKEELTSAEVQEETKAEKVEETEAEKRNRERAEKIQAEKEIKEKRKKAEEESDAVLQEIVNKPVQQREWTPELKEFMAQINEEHKAIIKPEADYEWFFEPRELGELDTSPVQSNEDGSLSIEQAVRDVEQLFYELKRSYGLYDYFGGDEVFEPAKEAIIKSCREMEKIDADTLTNIMIDNLSFVEDLHFHINRMRTIGMQFPFFYREVEFEKTENGYMTNDGRTVESVDGYENLDELFKRSLTKDGRIVYYPIVMVDHPLKNLMDFSDVPKEAPDDLTVHYADGSKQQLKTEVYANMEFPDINVEVHETDDIPVLRLSTFGAAGGDEDTKRLADYAEKLKDRPAMIMDMTVNEGGYVATPYHFWKIYTGEYSTENTYMLALIPFWRGSEIDEEKIYEDYWKFAMRREDLKVVENGRIIGAGPDKFTANENLFVLLTGKHSISAADEFTDMTHNIENTLIIGENTGGVLRNGSGKGAFLTFSQIQTKFGGGCQIFPEGYFEEGYGLEPDLWCPAAEAEEAAAAFINRMMK